MKSDASTFAALIFNANRKMKKIVRAVSLMLLLTGFSGIEGTQFCSPEAGFSVIAADKNELCLHMIDKNGKVLYTVRRQK